MEKLEFLSEFIPLIMTIVAIAIVICEWLYLSKKKLLDRPKEGWVNIYSGAVTYIPIFIFNTTLTISFMFVVYGFRIYTVSFAWYTWVFAYIAYDFMSFVIHWASHKVRVLWCIHSVHHSPKEMKASVSFRGSFAEVLLAPHLILWLPLLGFHPLQILVVEGIGQLYGVPLHLSEKLLGQKKTRWLERFIVTPSFHHLHHAKNDVYIDSNYALTFSVWDRIFNTYQQEYPDEKPEYGVSTAVDSENLYEAHTDEFKRLWADLKCAATVMDKIRYLLMPPGWRHDSVGTTAEVIKKQALSARRAKKSNALY